MKEATITLALAALFLAGCTASLHALDGRSDAQSWSAFCAARGINPADNSPEALDEYLDTWCGSVEEETALAR